MICAGLKQKADYLFHVMELQRPRSIRLCDSVIGHREKESGWKALSHQWRTMHGAFFLCLLEKTPPRDAPTPTNHLNKIWTELRRRHICLSCHSLGKQGLSRSGRTYQKGALGYLTSECCVFLGVLQEINYLHDFSLASSSPATSLKLIFTFDSCQISGLDLPTLKIHRLRCSSPAIRRMKKSHTTISRAGKGARKEHPPGSFLALHIQDKLFHFPDTRHFSGSPG